MNTEDFSLQFSNGIHLPHLSASTINSFLERRYSWFNQKVRRTPFKTNPAMCRGKAIEAAINEWLNGTVDPENLSKYALSVYDSELNDWRCQQKGYKPEEDVVRLSIPAMMEVGFAHFKDLYLIQRPTQQEKVSIQLDGVSRPVVGYMDYHIPTVRVDDCKVVGQSKSKLPMGYIIQGAVYRKATGVPVMFHFIVDNKKPVVKTLTLTDEEYSFGLRYMTRAAQVIEELEVCEDTRRMLELMSFPNLEVVWDDSEKKELMEQWGI